MRYVEPEPLGIKLMRAALWVLDWIFDVKRPKKRNLP